MDVISSLVSVITAGKKMQRVSLANKTARAFNTTETEVSNLFKNYKIKTLSS